MSNALLTAVWELEIGSTEKLVLLALADMANDSASCWPSMATIARKCGLKERATRLAMRRLEAAGHVSSIDRTGTSRLYSVHPGIKCRPAPDAPRHDVPVTPAPDAPKPSRTPISQKTLSSSKKRVRAKPQPPFPTIPEWIPAEPWNAWCEMRRGKGKALTARAADMAITKLKTLADDGQPPGAVLDQSTFELWTDLYPLKGTRNERPGGSPSSGPRAGQRRQLSISEAVLAAHDRVAVEG